MVSFVPKMVISSVIYGGDVIKGLDANYKVLRRNVCSCGWNADMPGRFIIGKIDVITFVIQFGRKMAIGVQ